ncbi:metal-dependent hydrolase [Pseudoalteromonas phenolica]|uniref:Metal-dependent hydrolase n=1 Tax=Pseudoalteromonas phenolica TaxID=161398 RepID=A0A5S3Z0Y3_9GAMM|nr:metal-dependent hydrolase [Pseudoalteromonas phenolica]TMP84242.1 metal-dependent hydrolase [Pseudoalteromonas phenolica]
MDSVTQILLGSAVGYATLGNKLGRKSLLVGAAFGTLPDLDVLINFGGDVENFVYHRSFSHSLIIQLLLSPLIAWLIAKMHWTKSVSLTRWSVAIFLIMGTHALLDTFTVYGTQLLWPVSNYPFGISSVFIIDPMYSLPLLLAFIALCFTRLQPYATKINTAALVLSSLYLTWSLAAKWHIDNKIQHALTNKMIAFKQFESTPSPFNTLLWRAVATTEQGHYEIYASIFDSVNEVDIRFYKTENHVLNLLDDDQRIALLQNFTKGLYGVYQQEQSYVFSDLRMGLEGFYVFSFEIAKPFENNIELSDFRQLQNRPPLNRASLVFKRITDPYVNLSLIHTE